MPIRCGPFSLIRAREVYQLSKLLMNSACVPLIWLNVVVDLASRPQIDIRAERLSALPLTWGSLIQINVVLGKRDALTL